MGKPFKKEIEKVYDTYHWANDIDISELIQTFFENSHLPLYIVGSGGSFSACHYAAALYQTKGMIAKAITPLELYYSKNALKNSNILFISASGRNTDILFALKIAVESQPNSIVTICMKDNTPLTKLAKQYSISNTYEFNIPAGKDGFLATNSLIAFFTILTRALDPKKLTEKISLESEFIYELNEFIQKIKPDYTFVVMYGGWGQPVSIDIESKFTEAALGNVLFSDYRNFGHGRHHWFAKRGKNSSIIALITPQEEKIALKTLALLPMDIPRLIIKSDHSTSIASIDLLIKSFLLADKIGEMQNIDPGRPGVPDYGSDLYHLKYSNFYKTSDSKVISQKVATAIIKKTNINSIIDLSENDLKYWITKYNSFLHKLTSTSFGALIFDYDGTICSKENRFNGPSSEVISRLIYFLQEGFVIGVVTGRGKSIREKLQEVIPKEYWELIIIGYYNGSDVGYLNDNKLPNINLPINDSLVKVEKLLKTIDWPINKIDVQVRPNQLTITLSDTFSWLKIKPLILQLIMKADILNIQILESSHSIDIIPRPNVSKLNIIEICQAKALSLDLSEHSLCFGDRGQWPGNDFELLSTPYSLSVDEVSQEPDSCWNLASSSIKNTKALLEYLNSLKVINKSIRFN